MFDRVNRFFKALFGALLGEAEGQMPLAVLEQSVREMIESLRVLREATATAIAFEKRTQRDLEAQDQRIASLEAQAEQALREDNEKLARRALQLQAEARAARQTAEGLYKQAQSRAESARAKLKVEEERVQGKIRQLGELKAIHQMNEAQRKLQSMTDEYHVDGAVNAFEKAAGSIRDKSENLSALDSLAVSEGEDLDRQLAALSKRGEVDKALDAMKARMAAPGTTPVNTAKAPAAGAPKVSSAFDDN